MNTSFEEGDNFNNSDNDDGSSEPENADLAAVLTFWRAVPPFLIILGTLGNILIIAVLVRSSMHKRTTGMFLCVLAVSDLLGLYIGLFPNWIEYVSGEYITEKGDFVCKVIPWLTYSVLDYSAWILVAVTVERVVATCYPLGSKDLCTLRFAKLYLIVSGIILLAINSHMLSGFEYKELTTAGVVNEFYCDETPDSYKQFFKHSWPWIDVTVYCLLPFAVIVVGNCVILMQVRRSHRKSLKKRSLSATCSRSMSLSRGKKKISTLTITMLLINTAFFVSTFPVSLFVLIEILSEDYFHDEKNEASIELWWAIVYNFMFVNNTFNVCLYCLSGTRFRHGVLALYRRIHSFRSGSISRSSGRAYYYSDTPDKMVSSTGGTPEKSVK